MELGQLRNVSHGAVFAGRPVDGATVGPAEGAAGVWGAGPGAERLQSDLPAGGAMASCDLVTEQEYVELMGRQLGPDQLGIVLRIPFPDEFFPGTAAERPPDALTV